MRSISDFTPRWGVLVDAARTRLWPVPAAAVVLSIVGGILATQLDTILDGVLPNSVTTFLFGGGAAAAREVLSLIAGSLITVTSLTFSLTLVTLQLASSQFSPRLLRTFARDRFVQRTLAIFLATFTYSLTVLRTVRAAGNGDPGFVPKISVTLAYLLALVSVMCLVLFLAHLVREIRVETMLQKVRSDALATAESALAEQDSDDVALPSPPPGAAMLTAPSSGFLVRIDRPSLLAAADDAGAVVELHRWPGEWLVADTPIGVAWPAEPGRAFDEQQWAHLREQVNCTLHTGNERTPVQDVGYALRQLTDVAIKALSPGINDPTTAVHALGHSSSLLCELSKCDLGPITLRDNDEAVRVVLHGPDLVDYLDLAVSQPMLYGADDAAVLSRLFSLLRELAFITTASAHHRAISVQLKRLQTTVRDGSFDDGQHRRFEQQAHHVAAALAGEWPGARLAV